MLFCLLIFFSSFLSHISFLIFFATCIFSRPFLTHLELELGEHHAAGGDTVDINLLVPSSQSENLYEFDLSLKLNPLESKDVKGFVHDLHLLHIVDGIDLNLAQAA